MASSVCQGFLFPIKIETLQPGNRCFGEALTVSVNRKGCVDVDTVKGCTFGMAAYPDGECYGECYARKISVRLGIDFSTAITRTFVDNQQHRDDLIRRLLDTGMSWYRIGVMGDPSHDWHNTLRVIYALRPANMTAAVVTKHWRVLTDEQISYL